MSLVNIDLHLGTFLNIRAGVLILMGILTNQVSVDDQKVEVLVIGAGLAGSEAAYYLASHGVRVALVECKRLKLNPAQKDPNCAELVCTNSLKSVDPNSAHGLMKGEMELLGSLILKAAHIHRVPAGDALAVDREAFSLEVTKALSEHPLITMMDLEVEDPLLLKEQLGAQHVLVATGPLTTKPLENWLKGAMNAEDLYFYDAIAPVVDGDSLDYTKLYFKDRHRTLSEDSEVEADYLNAPMTKEQYEQFVDEMIRAEKVQPKDFEEYRFFEACLPVDLMAERGVDTPRFSCMKPIGLEMDNGEIPYACVQLRKENLLGSAYNLVGFQTRLKYPEQVRVFRLIPGLEKAQFIHLGSVHRNTFLNAKRLLNSDFSTKNRDDLWFAGQMTGVEGYTESAATGLFVADHILRRLQGLPAREWPVETAIGALVNYVMTAQRPSPSNINFGLIPNVELPKALRRDRKNRKRIKKQLAADRARASFKQFLKGDNASSEVENLL
jgi:methylenetetrahydrofolate--tRNA-(uracil-5-)-methyltransferase